MKLKGPQAASLLLRLGLIAVFAYAAISSLVSPDDWVGYLPHQHVVSAGLLLKVFAIFELALVVGLIAAWRLRWVAWLCALTMAGVVVVNFPLFAITFRDLAIACAALALAALE